MGNNEFQISPSIRSEWIQKNSTPRRIFYNKISLEQFQLIVLSKLKTNWNIAQLIERSIYPLPATPKVIILNDNQGEVSILVQRPTFTLRSVICEIEVILQILLTIRQAATALHSLFLRHGPFAVTENLLTANQKKQPLFWINSNFESNDIQNNLPRGEHSEQQMVFQMMQLFKSMASLKLEQKIFTQPCQNFSRFIQGIEDAIEEERKFISVQKHKWKPVTFVPYRSFSPKSNRPVLIPAELQERCPKNKRITFGNNIPNFIKNIKKQKSKLKRDHIPKDFIPILRQNNNRRPSKKQISAENEKNMFSKVRSLNCSPEPTKITSTLKDSSSTANCSNMQSFAFASQGRLDRLAFSRQSNQPNTRSNPNLNLSIPLIHSFSSKELPEASLITEVNEEENIVQITFNKPQRYASGILNSFCKSMSQSRQFGDSTETAMLDEPNLSLQMANNMNESVVIHRIPGSGTFQGKYLALYEEIGKILF